MSQVEFHEGPHTTIHMGTTPGLQFLKRFVPLIEELPQDPSTSFAELREAFGPDARFFINGDGPRSREETEDLLEQNTTGLSGFEYTMTRAWDIPDTATGRRTVIYEAKLSAEYRQFRPQNSVTISGGPLNGVEVNILELAPVGAGQQGGFVGLWIVEQRLFGDVSPLLRLGATRVKRNFWPGVWPGFSPGSLSHRLAQRWAGKR